MEWSEKFGWFAFAEAVAFAEASNARLPSVEELARLPDEDREEGAWFWSGDGIGGVAWGVCSDRPKAARLERMSKMGLVRLVVSDA